MLRLKPTPIFLPLILILSLTAVNMVFAVSSTGYYLPRGYKCEALLYVPEPPFWPGEVVGDIVGLSTRDYSVLVEAYAWKGGILEGFRVEKGFRIVWVEGGVRMEKARVNVEKSGEHEVTLVYGHDGYVRISTSGRLLYSFIGTVDRYEIVAEGARVKKPEPLPVYNDGGSGNVGEGYNPPSIREVQIQYLLLGGLAVTLLTLILTRLKR